MRKVDIQDLPRPTEPSIHKISPLKINRSGLFSRICYLITALGNQTASGGKIIVRIRTTIIIRT